MWGVLAALGAASIWALVIFLYKGARADALSVNLSRTLYAAAATLPFGLAGASHGALAAAASGVLALALGDTLYLAAIRRLGASVAAPLVYIYVVMAQGLAAAMGEPVGPALYASSALAVLGVSLLSGGGAGRIDARGLAAALSAAAVWAVGQSAVKLAVADMHPLAVAFYRAAAASLAIAALSRGRARPVPSAALALASALDLGLGAALFAFAVSDLGLAASVVLVSLSPLMSQAYAAATGAEPVTWRKAAGALALFAAVALSVSRL